MKKSIVLLLCCISTISFLFAQTTTNAARIALRADVDTVLVGNQLCVKVVAFDFQNVDSLQMSIRYDGRFVRLDSVRQSTVGLARATSGTWPVKVTWKNTSPNTALPDSTVLFEICLSGIGSTTGSYSNLQIVNAPTSVKAFDSTRQVQEVAYAFDDWNFRHHVYPKESIGLAITDTVAAPGDQVCLRVEVVNFEQLLLGMQFGMQWNPAFLQFDHINFGNIPNLQTSGPGTNFGLTDTLSGKLRFAWNDFTSQGIKLDRGDRFFEVCFNVLDTTGTTEVAFSRSVLAFEFFDANSTFYNIAADNSVVSISDDPQIWPGDTNRDGTVNQFDLLQIGLAYGNLGTNRNDISTDWQAQPAADWTQNSPISQINYKHFDTDGNGLIELLDAIAIDSNWNLTTEDELRSPIFIQPREQGAPLYVRTKPILPAGQPVNFDIILGGANQKAEEIYGLAFSIEYDALLSAGNNSPISVTFDSSWLGEVGEDLLVLQRNNPEASRIDVALVRTDGQNRQGFGAIAQLNFIAPVFAGETPPGTDTVGVLPFRIQNVRAIDFAELEQLTAPLETTAVVDISTGIVNPALARKVRIFPNPVSDQFFIQTDGLTIQQIEIFNLQGQLLQRHNNVLHILTNALPTGMYTLRILTSEGIVIKSFVRK